MSAVSDAKKKMHKTIEVLKETLQDLRGGAASTAPIKKIMVNAYGDKVPLSQVATLSVPEPRTVLIQPWDRSTLSEIEKAIQQSSLSLNPSNDGKLIRIFFPPLSRERRVELSKEAKKIAEDAKVSVRNIRRQANDALDAQKKQGALSEDEHSHLHDEIQKLTNTHTTQISQLTEEKEKEIMEV